MDTLPGCKVLLVLFQVLPELAIVVLSGFVVQTLPQPLDSLCIIALTLSLLEFLLAELEEAIQGLLWFLGWD